MPEKSHPDRLRERSHRGLTLILDPQARKRHKPALKTGDKLYNKYAGMYDLLFDHVLRAGRKAAVRMLDAKPGDRVLEVGVGTGLSFRYYPRDVRLTGIDISSKMLQEARRRLRKMNRGDITMMQMDAMHLDFPDSFFDKVMACHVLSAVPDPRVAFDEIKRVCVPKGCIVVANRFQSRVPMFRAAEKAMNPIVKKMGFALDLSLDMLTQDCGLRIDGIRRVNVPGLWRVIRLVKEPSPAQAAIVQ